MGEKKKRRTPKESYRTVNCKNRYKEMELSRREKVIIDKYGRNPDYQNTSEEAG